MSNPGQQGDTSLPNGAEFRLIALSPTAGYGYFLRGRSTFRFDLLTEEDVDFGLVDDLLILEIDAIRCDVSFPNRADLIRYSTAEHLRAKKGEYLAAVFTRSWDQAVF